MPTPAEQKALLFLGAVALTGGLVRLLRDDDPTRPTAAEATALAAQAAAAESLAKADRSKKPAGKGKRTRGAAAKSAAEPVTPTAPLDLDRATEAQIEALPGIGPALARRIVSDRERKGPFGSLAALDGVPGVGPALLERVRPHVTFSSPPRPSNAVSPGPQGAGARSSGRVVGLVGGPP